MNNSVSPFDFRRPLRLLIVADGLIHFSATKFGLSEFIQKGITTGVNPWSHLEITTARRGEDFDRCSNLCDFVFDKSSFGIEKFDQVWLFGQEGEEAPHIQDSEIEVIADFMNHGGGVFATGDHKSLGAAMCGGIPRVRKMRKWFFKLATSLGMRAPGEEDETRLDTLQIGDPGFQMDDQSDNIPQRIQPKYFREPCGTLSFPHPLLTGRESPISVLPDHMHEGECVVPKGSELKGTFTVNGKEFCEFPVWESDKPMPPETVAIGTSAGGYWKSLLGTDVMPVEPRCFKVIVVYEGDRIAVDGTKLGRVVVDSSFHHFVDINLRGTGSTDPNKKGLYDANDNPTPEYESIKQYYRNIVKWLTPATVRMGMYEALLLELRFNSFLIEEISPLPSPEFNDILHAGAVTRKVLAQRFSPSEPLLCALSLLDNAHDPRLGLTMQRLLDPWRPTSQQASMLLKAINSTFFVDSILGIAMLNVANELPHDEFRAARKLSTLETPLTLIPRTISNDTLAQLASVIDRSREKLGEISSLLQPSPPPGS